MAQRIDSVADRIDSLELYCNSAEFTSLKPSKLLLPRPIPTIFKTFSGYTRSTSLVYHARLTHALMNPKPYLDSNAQSTPNAPPPLFEHPSTTINLMVSKRFTKLLLALPILP
ncbi:hypothetical protein PIB30_074808 [Stylosanthes scabra]|uniref:Uncharacterized protein n=1 Tax=Stylosanthes scabra TaxID=79078 RepID=A0ABU6VSB9_9FABA|nr:hypothetical protein [Stylosanthes scabra]